MKVLFCSSEVVPFAKTGGLADVSGALPLALERQGCQVKVALPKYRCARLLLQRQKIEPNVVKMGKDIDVYFVENDQYFERQGLYGEGGIDYSDNLERFVFFCRRILYLLQETNFAPEIIHCNDWQTALIPVYLKTLFKDNPLFFQTKTIFTVHNLAYHGSFSKDKFAQTGLKEELFNTHGLEFYSKINLLKGGLVFSRFITTVSPTYAQEIQSPGFGCGLDGVLRERKKDLVGILNGLDYSVWNPLRDDKIFRRYGQEDLINKDVNKKGLQQELNLPCDVNVPLLGIVTRLASQKGIELITFTLEQMSKLNLQFILLGTGDAKYHLALEKIKQKGYKNISINLRFDAALAHKIYAGCDMFLMPSYYEPCGLGQLIALKYGTIPIVRKTGGLADTIVDYNLERKQGNGFVFTGFTSRAMLKTIGRAIALYRKKQDWHRLILKAMDYDFSWENSAQRYIELYNRALNSTE